MEHKKSITEIKAMYDRLKAYVDTKKDCPEKFMPALQVANEENIDLTIKYGIKLKPSAWSVLSIEPAMLEKTLVRAKELGFLDAYVQNASFLKQDVDVVFRRMGELEHLNIPYKNEKGKYLPFLFSARGFTYVKNEKENGEKKSLVLDYELKELADRLIETYVIIDKDSIYEKLMALQTKGLSKKEVLMELFKDQDDLDHLNILIDELLESYEEVKGRAA